LAHDRLADRFDDLMNAYDLRRRLETLVDLFLDDDDLKGKRALDAGCGTGAGAARLGAKGAVVFAVDIGIELVRLTRSKSECSASVASLLTLPFQSNSFDVVFSSEVIEHTSDPLAATRELCRVLRPGGHLVLSTPNRLWQPPVRLASWLGVRPYDGLENFVWPRQLASEVGDASCIVIEQRGLHLLPFQLHCAQGLLEKLDGLGVQLLPLMINQCLHAVKRNL